MRSIRPFCARWAFAHHIGVVLPLLVVLELVASFQAFGTLLAVGPLLLPAAAARCWGLGVVGSMALATLFGAAASVAGLLVSYHGNLPSGPAIVLAGGTLFATSLIVTGLWRRVAPIREEGVLMAPSRRIVCMLAIVAVVVPPLGSGRAAEPVLVVATFSVIADMLANVGGSHIVVTTIVRAGGDCELYQPTPADVATLAGARAVFFNGLNDEFEPWLEPLLKQAAFKGVKVAVYARGRGRFDPAEEEHPISGRQLPTAIDQHAWLDPRNGIIYVRNIAEALARLDPANAADYRAALPPTRYQTVRPPTIGRAMKSPAFRSRGDAFWPLMIHCGTSPAPMGLRC